MDHILTDISRFRWFQLCTCMQECAIDRNYKQYCKNGRLSGEASKSVEKTNPLFDALNILLKEPHIALPANWEFKDNMVLIEQKHEAYGGKTARTRGMTS